MSRKSGDTLGRGGGSTQRRIDRKLEKATRNSVSGAGRSLLEILKEELAKAAEEFDYAYKGYMRDSTDERYAEMKLRRGILRGVAMGVAIIESPYSYHRSCKVLEKSAVKKVRARWPGDS